MAAEGDWVSWSNLCWLWGEGGVVSVGDGTAAAAAAAAAAVGEEGVTLDGLRIAGHFG